MRAFFIGTVHFSKAMLEKLLENNGIEIVGLATKKSSSFNSDFCDLSSLVVERGIPYQYVDDINSADSVKWIRSLNVDVVFCLGWSSLIKKEVLDIPRLGVIGYHPAELPKNRGRHPIIWALVLGLTQTASTFFLMDEGADTGDIISQEKVTINFEDNAHTLYQKLTNIALVQIDGIVDACNKGLPHRISQAEHDGNYWRKRSKKDGRIDWRMKSEDIYNLVRALHKPYPGAHFEYKNEEITVWKCTILDKAVSSNIEPGKVMEVAGNSIIVKSGDGAVKLTDYELKHDNIAEYLL